MINWENFWSVFGVLVSSIGGVGVIITGVCGFFAKLYIDTTILKFENKVKYQFDILNKTVSRYNEEQFKKYNEIWQALYSLKLSADSLWHSAENKSLSDFVKNYKITNETIGLNCLFIEETHYVQLLNLLRLFGQYGDGKNNLIIERSTGKIQKGELYWINNNREILAQYSLLIEEIRKEFRKQLHFQDNQIAGH